MKQIKTHKPADLVMPAVRATVFNIWPQRHKAQAECWIWEANR